MAGQIFIQSLATFHSVTFLRLQSLQQTNTKRETKIEAALGKQTLLRVLIFKNISGQHSKTKIR